MQVKDSAEQLAVKKAAHLAASCWKNFAVSEIEGKRVKLNLWSPEIFGCVTAKDCINSQIPADAGGTTHWRAWWLTGARRKRPLQA